MYHYKVKVYALVYNLCFNIVCHIRENRIVLNSRITITIVKNEREREERGISKFYYDIIRLLL